MAERDDSRQLRRSRISAAQKLRERCVTLAELIPRMAQVYRSDLNTANQLHFIETILGAAIWYLPSLKQQLWTGQISVQAIRECHPDSGVTKPKFTEDHVIPRKYAAQELLERDWSAVANVAATLEELYLSRYGRFHYVTPRENKVLVEHQKKGVFINPETAYRNAGVQLITVSVEQLKRIRKRDARLIEEVLIGSGVARAR
jgi:hypothetical protein